MELDASTITVIGASWCPDCRRTKTFLAEQRVAFNWVDLEQHPEATEIVELADKLGLSRSAECDMYDVIIVGGDPTGLTAAIYAARENQSVLIIEKSAPGGQAGVTERLDNYPGFPDGVPGYELADRMSRQAERYGVEI